MGKELLVYFPNADDKSKGAILDSYSEEPVYIISRSDYLPYEDEFD